MLSWLAGWLPAWLAKIVATAVIFVKPLSEYNFTNIVYHKTG